MSYSWLIFPAIQVILTAFTAIFIVLWGAKISNALGGGIVSRIIWTIAAISVLLTSYTIFALLGYFYGSILLSTIGHLSILAIAIIEIALVYNLKKFLEGIEKMNKGD